LAVLAFRVTFLKEENFMKEKSLTVPEIGLIAATRVILGVGIGLLLSDKLSKYQRQRIGWTLLAAGALSTLPIAANVLLDRTTEMPAEETDSLAC
jgi:hypothetical protein